MGYDVSMIDGHIDESKGLSYEEIMKKYHRCMGDHCDNCSDGFWNCNYVLPGDVYDLLKRLKADNEMKRIKIEKLQHELDTLKSRK